MPRLDRDQFASSWLGTDDEQQILLSESHNMTFDSSAVDEVGKLLNTEPAKALLSPASNEIGGLLGDIASVARFYGTRNLEAIFTRWAHNRRDGKTIEAADVQRVMPLLPAASMQSDCELQERWAVLLESAATADISYLPSFGQTLSQLTAEEAKFLDRLRAFATRSRPDPSSPIEADFVYPQLIVHDHDRSSPAPDFTEMEPLEEVELINIFDPAIEIISNPWSGMRFKDEFPPFAPRAPGLRRPGSPRHHRTAARCRSSKLL